jgi:hypothetical protein
LELIRTITTGDKVATGPTDQSIGTRGTGQRVTARATIDNLPIDRTVGIRVSQCFTGPGNARQRVVTRRPDLNNIT